MNLWTFLLTALVVGQGIGFCVFLAGVRKAPEGYQDQTGFHEGRESAAEATVIALPSAHASYDHAA